MRLLTAKCIIADRAVAANRAVVSVLTGTLAITTTRYRMPLMHRFGDMPRSGSSPN